jgi:hypothetical protein
MISISVEMTTSWDYSEPEKTASSYSGVINSQVTLAPFATDELDLRTIKWNIGYHLTNALAGGKRPSLVISKKIKSQGNVPTIYAEIESVLDGGNLKHGINLGIHMPDPKSHSVAKCLEAYAHTIASSVVDLLPTKEAVEKALTASTIRALSGSCCARPCRQWPSLNIGLEKPRRFRTQGDMTLTGSEKAL